MSMFSSMLRMGLKMAEEAKIKQAADDAVAAVKQSAAEGAPQVEPAFATHPVSDLVFGSWAWLVAKVKAAYAWTAEKIEAGRTWLTSTAGYQAVAPKVATAAAWVVAQPVLAHQWLQTKSEGYTWVCEKLNNGRIRTTGLLTDGVVFIYNTARYLGAWVAFAGHSVLQGADWVVTRTGDFFRGQQRATVVAKDGTLTQVMTRKDGSVVAVVIAAQHLRAAPVLAYYFIDVEAMMEKAGEAMRKATEVAKAAVAAGAAAACATMTTPATAMEVPAAPVHQFTAAAVHGHDEAAAFFAERFEATEQSVAASTPEQVMISFNKGGALAADEMHVGDIAKNTDVNGVKLLVVATRLGAIVVSEQASRVGAFDVQISAELEASGALNVGNAVTLAQLQMLLGTTEQPNFGQHIEKLYGACLSAHPSA